MNSGKLIMDLLLRCLLDIGNLLRVLVDPLTIRRRVMHWKRSLTIAMVVLIATVAVVAFVATAAVTSKTVHASNSAIETIATAPPTASQDIDTVAAGIVVGSLDAGVISQREPAQVAEGNEVALAIEDAHRLRIDSPVAAGIVLGSTFNLAKTSSFPARPANSPPISTVAFEVLREISVA